MLFIITKKRIIFDISLLSYYCCLKYFVIAAENALFLINMSPAMDPLGEQRGKIISQENKIKWSVTKLEKGSCNKNMELFIKKGVKNL